ncbi:EDD domain protein [Vulcanibacillus modesticaldus]|uniref:EDD domain protein n=1 Tax=Vulcanibacillus modesticaldus TaxID=337097 RepID=A0A1D2YX56_9BACI|nr:DegV family protein [Vulcanibacillus modesticaldus]OEG00341.1 EDD domain protein [Vulcanibacillus modesticaldus]
MEKVYVVTDSTADIPKDLIKSLGIEVVPLKVHFEAETYLDGETITANEFYKKLEKSDQLPTTSQPSPLDFVEVYKRLAGGEKAKIVSIHLSSALSGTVQSALLAKTMVEEDGIEVTVIDSKKASYSIGIIVVGVAKAIKEGKNYEEITELARKLVAETQVYFLVESLNYLYKGGRIGRASHLVGSLLNIKPILSLNEHGEVYAIDKVRGRNRATSRILEFFKDFAHNKPVNVGISHAANYDEAKRFEDKLREIFDIQDFVITNIGPVIGTHVGQGTVAITMYPIE